MPHYIIPAPVPVTKRYPQVMDPRHQLDDLARASMRRIDYKPFFDHRSQTYGCQIIEYRQTSSSTIVSIILAEAQSQPDKTTAEISAALVAIQTISRESAQLAINSYSRR
jgi:hypothetical protein